MSEVATAALVRAGAGQQPDVTQGMRSGTEGRHEPRRAGGAITGSTAELGIYEELGVRSFINAVAPHTRYGGSIMAPAVLEAMAEAARRSVHLDELQRAAGRAIASLTRNEACYIACGAASGVQLAVAACIVGPDEKLAERLPRIDEKANVVMLKAHRGTEADRAIRNTGAILRWVGDDGGATIENLVSRLDGHTAAVVAMDWRIDGMPDVAGIVEAAHERGIPVIVDAADGVPPASTLWRHTREAGADAVVVSGGKGLRGPQNAGLVLGSCRIVDGCAFLGSPNDRFGRSMKVSKEAIAGMYAAVRHFLADERELAAAAQRQADILVREISTLNGVSLDRDGNEVFVRVHDPHLPVEEICSRLMVGEPAVLAFCRKGVVRFNAAMLQPGEEHLVARRLRHILSR